MRNAARSSSSQIVHRGAAEQETARHRYRYRRRHRPHFYSVVVSVSGAVLACIVNAIAYLDGGVGLAEIAFACVFATACSMFLTFFLGFTMVMSGHIPAHRLRVLVPHGAVGVLSPLLYTINVSIDLDRWGKPLSGAALLCSLSCLLLLAIQAAMGKAVVRPDPIRIVK